MRHLYFLLIGSFLLFSCTNTTPTTNSKQTADTLENKIAIMVSDHEEDVVINEFKQEALAPIRQNFKRINSIDNWDKIDSVELWMSTEGGQANYYYKNKKLEKIIAYINGEMGRSVEEYYFLNNTISFIYEKQYQYNRPIYYDSNIMNRQDDTEVFNIDKSEIVEKRNYFINGQLIHHIDSEDCGAPFAEDYLLEVEQYTLAMVDTLMAMRKM